MAGHYAVRVPGAGGRGGYRLNVFLSQHDRLARRRDQRAAQLAFAADRELLDKLDTKQPGRRSTAYVSPKVPEAYVQTRLNLLSTLRELQALGGGKIE